MTEELRMKHISEYLPELEAEIIREWVNQFGDVVRHCLGVPELVEHFDRLQGSNLSRRGTPLELKIDDSTGRYEADIAAFIIFVKDAIWSRLPEEFFSDA